MQTEAYQSMLRALAGDPTPVERRFDVAEGIAVAWPGRAAGGTLLADAGARIVTVSERAMEGIDTSSRSRRSSPKVPAPQAWPR